MRALFRDAVLNRNGNGVQATIEVRQVGTSTPIVETIYDSAGSVLANPFTTGASGEFTFYLDEPKRVDLYVTAEGFTAETQQVDVLNPAEADEDVAAHALSADPHPNLVLVESFNGRSGVVVPLQTDYDGFFLTPAEGNALYQLSAEKGIANGYASLDAGAKVPTTQLPALAITETFVVGSEAAMLALTAQEGDVAVRTDLSKSFILTTDDPTQVANWQELLTPADAVSSFNGRTGAVMPLQADYDAFFLTPAEGNAAYLAKPALTDGSVLFAASGQVAQDNANLFWDDTNNRLGARMFFLPVGSSTGDQPNGAFIRGTGTDTTQRLVLGGGSATAGNSAVFAASRAANQRLFELFAFAGQTADLFRITASDFATAMAFFTATGDLVFGSSVLDSGVRLQVQGAASEKTAIFRANATTPGNIIEAQNSGGTAQFTVSAAGVVNVVTSYQVAGTKVIGAQGSAVANASGGAIIDIEARAALNALLQRCRDHGLIAA